MEAITIYAVFLDMEDEKPDAYVLHENMAKALTAGNDAADYVEVETTEQDYMALLVGRR